MKTYIQSGKTITVTAPYDVTSGMLVLVGSIVGIAAFDASSGSPVEVSVEGCYTVNKTSALAINFGDLVYLDDTNHVVNKTSSAQKLVGVAISSVTNPSSTVDVRLSGALAQ